MYNKVSAITEVNNNRRSNLARLLKIASTKYIASLGDNDSDKAGMITMIQRALADLGYPLEVDGEYGEETAEAVVAFRDINGLSDSHSVDFLMFRELFSIGARGFDDVDRSSKLMSLMTSSVEEDVEGNKEDSFSDEGSSVSESSLYSDLMASLNNRNLCIAMVANAIHESALKPDIAGDCGEYARSEKRRHRSLRIREKGLCCSFGLWQLNICGGLGITFLEQNGNPSSKRERRALLSNYNKQLNFMVSYLKSRYSSLIRQDKTVGEWTEWFVREVERPADPDGATASRSSTAERLDREIAYA